MSLTWKESKAVNPFEAAVGDVAEYIVHLSEFEEVDDSLVKSIVEECIEKSIAYFPVNIKDESLFFLCEWDCVYSMLTLVVTDDKKENDSPIVVKCCFTGLDAKFQKISQSSEDEWENTVNSYSQKVRDWIKDYLTTCSSFTSYSLVAAFHSEDRSASELL